MRTPARDGQRKKGGMPEDIRPEVVAMPNVLELKSKSNSFPAISSETSLVSPEIARFLRDNCHFERQRTISGPNVARLAKEMEAGRFTPGTQIYICVLPTGQEFIINGNHTLEAIALSNVPQTLTITHCAVKDIDEAGKIYAVFDTQKLRTWADSLRASGKGDDVPNAPTLLSAIGSIQRHFSQDRKEMAGSRMDRIDLIEDYKDASALFDAAISGCGQANAKLVRRAPVMGIALETFRHQPSFATEFWHKVSHDNGLTNNMPERALITWLRNNTGNGWLPSKESAKATAGAWNAAFRGEDRQFLKPSMMSCLYILGTPWANGVNEE